MMAESKVYNSDCLAAMREMPDKAFDLAIVDPPYGKKPSRDGVGATVRKFSQRDNHWDVLPTDEYFNELMRVSVNQIIFGANHLLAFLQPTNCFIVWDKKNDFSVMADCELAWTSFPTVTKIFRYEWNGMLQENMANKERRIHPTQKPVALYKWLLTNYAKPGDTILDTHLGSGSSRIAAYDLGFDFTGYELDTDYFNAQEERFARHIAQPNMFAPEPVVETQEALFE